MALFRVVSIEYHIETFSCIAYVCEGDASAGLLDILMDIPLEPGDPCVISGFRKFSVYIGALKVPPVITGLRHVFLKWLSVTYIELNM